MQSNRKDVPQALNLFLCLRTSGLDCGKPGQRLPEAARRIPRSAHGLPWFIFKGPLHMRTTLAVIASCLSASVAFGQSLNEIRKIGRAHV